MEIYEIAGYQTGVSKAGVNFLQPSDSFQDIFNGFIYRQVIQSRQGFGYFAPQLFNQNRVTGIFEHTLTSVNATELLVFDQDNMYRYDSGVFTLIPFAGTMAGYAGFNLIAHDAFISGTSYPTSSNSDRFVFTSPTIRATGADSSGVFFYDGTNIKNFCSVADNLDYQAPLGGSLNNAKYITWFGERLNLISPVVGGTFYPQGMLYSGIRTVSGNGDKFAVAGSGQLNADTYEFITGFSLLGQILSLSFDRSNWVIEKTRDAFNPYFIRKVPSVLGTNADFSAVSWNDKVRSMGKTGVIETDARQTLRVDNKIPYFTQDDVNEEAFNTTYGGFDRFNNQYLWAYVESDSGDLSPTKVLVNDYEEETWSKFDMRFTVFGQTTAGINLTWDQIDETSGNASWSQWDTTEELWDRIGLGKSVQKTLAGDQNGFVFELNQDFDDYESAITGITIAPFAELTVGPHAFFPGDFVAIENVEGMTEINNWFPQLSQADGDDYVNMIKNFKAYYIQSVTATTVVLQVNSLLFTAYTTGGTISKVIDFSATTIPFNPWRSSGLRCYISHVEFLLDTQGGYLFVDVIEDEEEDPFIKNVLILPMDLRQSTEWITMTVNNESNFMTFVLRQSNAATQVKIKSIRIHCAPGGYTSG